MFDFLHANGIEVPARQFQLVTREGTPIYLDFAWDLRTKALEFDGLASRADSRAHDQELERQNDILELGWRLRRFSPVALRDRPRETYRKILRYLES